MCIYIFLFAFARYYITEISATLRIPSHPCGKDKLIDYFLEHNRSHFTYFIAIYN